MQLSGCQVAVNMLSWVCLATVAERRVALAPTSSRPPCAAAIALTPALSSFAGWLSASMKTMQDVVVCNIANGLAQVFFAAY